MKRKATQKEVAKAADVSQTLVSLVFNGMLTDVAEQTRRRILEEAKRLGYTPKKKIPASNHPKVIGYIRPAVTRGHHGEHWIYASYEDFYDKLQNHIVETASKRGYSVIVRPVGDAKEITHWLSEWTMAGVLWQCHDQKLAEWVAARCPMVQINRHNVINADAVSANQEELLLTALEHLYAQGHRRILYLPKADIDRLRRLRTQAYKDFVEDHGLPSWQHVFDSPEIKPGTLELEAALNILSEPIETRPTALIGGDHNILRFFQMARDRGIRVPEDLSCVGIDNISASHFSDPALTTVDTRNDEIARVAVNTLIERIENPEMVAKKILISPTLIERKSVTAPLIRRNQDACSVS